MKIFQKSILYYIACMVLCLSLLPSCVKDDTEAPDMGTFYMINTRADIGNNHQQTDPDTRVHELRLLLFPVGEDLSVVNYYSETDEEDYSSGVYKAKFKMERNAHFDVYAIANESASGQIDSDLAFLRQDIVSRRELESTKNVRPVLYKKENCQENGMDREKGLMMTAAYKNMSLDRQIGGSGSEADPYVLSFEEENRRERPELEGDRSAIELLRCMAKVEIVYKSIVSCGRRPDRLEPNDGPAGEEYVMDIIKEDGAIVYVTNKEKQYWPVSGWVAPAFYKNDHRVQLINMPAVYSLFPTGKVQTSTEMLPPTAYTYHIDENLEKPDMEHLVLSKEYWSFDPDPEYELELPIGGTISHGYKVCFYIPEYICPENLPDDKKPALKFTYKSAPFLFAEESDYKWHTETFLFENSAQRTNYEVILGSDPKERADYNIYRNRQYVVWVDYSCPL